MNETVASAQMARPVSSINVWTSVWFPACLYHADVGAVISVPYAGSVAALCAARFLQA